MDRLDARLARFLGPAATARCIPEAVKRFTTWAPLLLPFYIPRGADWDYAWSKAEAIQRAHPVGVLQQLLALPHPEQGLILASVFLASTALFSLTRRLRTRRGARRPTLWSLSNPEYEVTLAMTAR